jgi:hypothetical protein
MRRTRSSILTLILAAALSVLAVPTAQAEDAFYLESSTGMKFAGEYMDVIEPGCWFGPTGNMIEGNAAEDGSIRSDISPFDQCSDAWGSALGFGLNGQNYFGFNFGAYDWGLASATLDCEGRGVESAEAEGVNPIERLMSAEVDGLTCTIEWLPGARPSASSLAQRAVPSWHSRLVSSLAPVANGKAKVKAQLFGPGRRTVRDRVVLRIRSGRLIGEGVGSTRAGSRPGLVPVPLAPFARRLLAANKELVVRASVTHADGTPGTGDETKQLVLRSGSPR